MPTSPSCPTPMRSALSSPPTRDRRSNMRGKTFQIAMLSAFVSLAAFTVQEADARGGRGGGGGGRGGGGGGFRRGGGGGRGFRRGGGRRWRGGFQPWRRRRRLQPRRFDQHGPRRQLQSRRRLRRLGLQSRGELQP